MEISPLFGFSGSLSDGQTVAVRQMPDTAIHACELDAHGGHSIPPACGPFVLIVPRHWIRQVRGVFRIPGGPPGLCGAGPTRTLPGFTGQIRGINNSKSRDWCTHRDSQRCSHRYRTCAILALLAHFLLLRRDRIAECFNILFKQDRLGHRTARISTCLRKMRIPKSCFPSKLDRENGDHRIVKIFFSILPGFRFTK